jgi:uncharacterized oligopeptide transporter (OPT) family protein
VIILELVGRSSGEPTGGGLLGRLNPVLARVLVGIIAALWIWFAGIIIAQCTGMTDWSPISGMSILTVVLVLALLGTGQVFAAVLMGSALCVAISCSADMMGDLKTGYLIGASPRKQQLWQIITSAIGPIITMATLLLIMKVNVHRHNVPIGPGTDTEAPQAVALEAVIKGMQGGGDMPYLFYGLGAIVGILLGLGAFPGLGVLVGISMYLPVMYVLTYGVGCIVNIIIVKWKGPEWAENWGVPFCAGLVVGEATLALVTSGIILYQGYQAA